VTRGLKIARGVFDAARDIARSLRNRQGVELAEADDARRRDAHRFRASCVARRSFSFAQCCQNRPRRDAAHHRRPVAVLAVVEVGALRLFVIREVAVDAGIGVVAHARLEWRLRHFLADQAEHRVIHLHGHTLLVEFVLARAEHERVFGEDRVIRRDDSLGVEVDGGRIVVRVVGAAPLRRWRAFPGQVLRVWDEAPPR